MCNFEPEKMKKVPFSGIREMKERAARLEEEGAKVIHFDIGQPDFVTPDFIREAAKKALDEGHTSYTSNFGIQPLREAIAGRLRREKQIAFTAANIIVTAGGEEAVSASLFALLDAGDEVIVPTPGYNAYEYLIRMANGVPVTVPLREENDFTFDIDELEKKITGRTKMIIICSPCNPTGTIMDRSSLEELAGVCIRHNLLVISDEAYEKIVYDGNDAPSIASVPGMEKRTIVVHSFSKSDSMCGWRIGYLAAAESIVNVIVRAHQYMVLSANSSAQYGALAAVTVQDAAREKMLMEFDRRRKFLRDELKRIGLPCRTPKGAFYMFPNVSCLGMDGREFCDKLLAEKYVAAVPGEIFGESAKYNVRISYATGMEDCKEGMRRIGEFVEEVRKGK